LALSAHHDGFVSEVTDGSDGDGVVAAVVVGAVLVLVLEVSGRY